MIVHAYRSHFVNLIATTEDHIGIISKLSSVCDEGGYQIRVPFGSRLDVTGKGGRETGTAARSISTRRNNMDEQTHVFPVGRT